MWFYFEVGLFVSLAEDWEYFGVYLIWLLRFSTDGDGGWMAKTSWMEHVLRAMRAIYPPLITCV